MCSKAGASASERTWARIIGQIQDPCKAVQAIANCKVNGLPKDPVALLRVGDHLQGNPSMTCRLLIKG